MKKRLSDTDYVLCTPDRRRKTRACHINLLKRYQPSKDSDNDRSAGAPSLEAEVEPGARRVC